METKKVGCFVVVVFTFFGQEVLSPKNIKQSGSESAFHLLSLSPKEWQPCIFSKEPLKCLGTQFKTP